MRADASRLKQLLESLIQNALKHWGGVLNITISDLDDGFYIGDDGPGIRDDEQKRVFEPGYPTSDKGSGFYLI